MKKKKYNFFFVCSLKINNSTTVKNFSPQRGSCLSLHGNSPLLSVYWLSSYFVFRSWPLYTATPIMRLPTPFNETDVYEFTDVNYYLDEIKLRGGFNTTTHELMDFLDPHRVRSIRVRMLPEDWTTLSVCVFVFCMLLSLRFSTKEKRL
jgi:hypothetical protein